MTRVKDIAGQKFHYFTAIAPTEERQDGSVVWLVLCECGTIVRRSQRRLAYGAAKSCGCSHAYHRNGTPGRKTTPEHRALRTRYHLTKAQGLKRGHAFELAFEEFLALAGQTCAYCGAAPSNTATDPATGERFAWQGVDRVDNARGYVAGNVVPCCRTCNIAKNGQSLEEFRAWAERLCANMSSWTV